MCNVYGITCQLDRIADSLSAFDWGAFIATIIATLLGAAVALLGAWLLDRSRSRYSAAQAKLEAQDRYERRLDEAFYRLLLEAGERAHYLATVRGSVVVPPSNLHASANITRMVAKNEDAKATKAMQYAIDRIANISMPMDQRRYVQILSQIVRAWRSGSHDAAEATNRFTNLVPELN